MASTTTEQELIDLELKYWQALKERDFETAMELTDDPCIVTGAQGVSSFDHDTFERMMKNVTYDLKRYEVDEDDIEVRLVTDDVAVLAYKVHEELTVDGKPVSLDAADSSTWVRKDGRWVCVLHTESISGDPFGRDRNGGGTDKGKRKGRSGS